MTSNAWRLWATKAGDVYIACRDNFKEIKVSLHASGRWRMGFTTDAFAKYASLIPAEQNRAWEIWDQPAPAFPSTIVAFRLIFPTSELAVRPEQRTPDQWKGVVFIEPAPPGKVAVTTLFVTHGDILLSHATEPSICLASLDIGNGRRAQLVAHGEPDTGWSEIIEANVLMARNQAEQAGVIIPVDAYAYFFGKNEDNSRYIFGARMHRETKAG